MLWCKAELAIALQWVRGQTKTSRVVQQQQQTLLV